MPAKKKVFIAEDEEPVFISLKKLLLFSGFDVDGAMNAREVVPQIKSFKPDAILLDIKMPELSGFEICALLKTDGETKNIPIFVLSALAGEEDLKKAAELGVVGYFSKPYDYLKLKREIESAIDKAK
jgi:putative two-component system response regulator